MKITLKTILFATVFTLGLNSAFAHAFWVKTNVIGKKGQSHAVEVFFAEPAGKHEHLNSDEMRSVKKFTLWVLAPGKGKTKLDVIDATDHYHASFTPETDGQYRIILQNEEIEVADYQAAGIYKSNFFASAAVNVGTVTLEKLPPSGFKFTVSAEGKLSPNQPVTVILEHQQIDLSKVVLSVYNQQGWKLDVKIDKQSGKGTFNCMGAGLYFIEAAYNNKENGSYNGKAYNSAYYAATELIEVL
jgi:hypothetical protein